MSFTERNGRVGTIDVTIQEPDEASCNETRQGYLDMYHPLGYSTYISQPRWEESTKLWVCTGWRYTTCD